MCFNPMLTTAENLAFVANRDAEQRAAHLNRTVEHQIHSIPNGQHYGKNGHIPCDHYAEFLITDRVNNQTLWDYRTYGPKGFWTNGMAPSLAAEQIS